MNDFTTSLAPVTRFLGKYHTVLFTSFICIMLAGAIFALYQVLSISETTTSTGSSIAPFDKETIKRIDDLSARGDKATAELVFPSPRSNPFAE